MFLFGIEALFIGFPWSTILILISLLFLTQCGKSESRIEIELDGEVALSFSCFYSRQRTEIGYTFDQKGVTSHEKR